MGCWLLNLPFAQQLALHRWLLLHDVGANTKQQQAETPAAAAACLQSLVGLNFNQEAVEADMRYGLVRVRENAESIAFYGGQNNEMAALMEVRGLAANWCLHSGRR
jgi:hypothetical protein